MNFGSAGTGGANHLSGELFKSMTGVSMVHIPYKGAAPALNDLLGGQIPIMFDSVPGVLQHIKAGKFSALAVTSLTRSAALPDVPTMDEAGVKGFEATAWFGLYAPGNMDPKLLAKLSGDVLAALRSPSIQEQFAQQGALPGTMTQPEYASFVNAEMDKGQRHQRRPDHHPVGAGMTATPSTAPARGALSHIRVLDLSRILAGPWCTQNLADLGADVIKVERPGTGDDTRAWGAAPIRDGAGQDTRDFYYAAANRGKKSLTLDISKPEGQRIVRELAAQSDVVIENYKIGDLKRYGLDYASLRAINPRLVYCSITGYGQEGPSASKPGYDFVFQAIGGLMSITGERDDLPGGGLQEKPVAKYADVGYRDGPPPSILAVHRRCSAWAGTSTWRCSIASPWAATR
ncbi:tripartite tricarboxylate transporter substrate-binding protein (plasmid) [Achromobacter denitrificans]